MKTILSAKENYSLKDGTLEFFEGVEEIDRFLFKENKEIKKIIFPSTIKRIYGWAFSGVCNLEEVVFNDGLEVIAAGAFEGTKVKRMSLPKTIKRVESGALGEAEEIEYYDNIDPNWERDYPHEKIIFDENPMTLGYSSLKKYCSLPFNPGAIAFVWNDCTITIKSSETDQIKYKVWMGDERKNIKYRKFLLGAWGANGVFNFRTLDDWFTHLRSKRDKLKIAEYRLSFPIELGNEAKNNYMTFLRNHSDKADEIISIFNAKSMKEESKTSDKLENSLDEKFLKVLKQEVEDIKCVFSIVSEVLKKQKFTGIRSEKQFSNLLSECETEIKRNLLDKTFADSLYLSPLEWVNSFYGEENKLRFIVSRVGAIVDGKYSRPEFCVIQDQYIDGKLKPNMYKEQLCNQLDSYSDDEIFERMVESTEKLKREAEDMFIVPSASYFQFKLSGIKKKRFYLLGIDQKNTDKIIENINVGDELSYKLEEDSSLEGYRVEIQYEEQTIGVLDQYPSKFVIWGIKDDIACVSVVVEGVEPIIEANNSITGVEVLVNISFSDK